MLSKFNQQDLKGLRRVRNKSSHDYDDIQNDIIEDIIHTKLPKLKQNIIENIKQNLYIDLQKNGIKLDDFYEKCAKDILKNHSKQR